MAKKKKPIAVGANASASANADAIAQLERPGVNWKVMLQIGLGFVALWVLALMTVEWIGYWGVGVAGVLTLVALGFGVYIFRLTRRSAAIVDIMKGATDAEGRKAAIEQLRAQQSGAGQDVMRALAEAQLVAQENPQEAIALLRALDAEKVPSLMQSDYHAQLALLYLLTGKPKDARPHADEIRLDRQPQAKAKAMYAAVMAETFARTGDPKEALDLVETYPADDPAYGDTRSVLLRAQVYTFVANKKRGLAQKSVEQLVRIDPNMVASLMQRGARPDVAKIARQVLMKSGAAPQLKQRVRMR